MPAMLGIDEQEAIEHTDRFLDELAKKLERQHARFGGLHRPIRFRRAPYTGMFLGEKLARPRSLADQFVLEAKGAQVKPHLHEPSFEAIFFKRSEWCTVGVFGFGRADWDDTPEMRSAICMLYAPGLLPIGIRDEIRRFIKEAFGCERVTYFTPQTVSQLMN